MVTDLRYPIGTLTYPPAITLAERARAIEDIGALPANVRAAVNGLSDAQLDTPYRPGGWTVRQVVHHVADSHMHAYIRLKFALTEETPVIKPYDEKTWSALADMQLPVEISLSLLDAIHARWVAIYASMGPEDFARAFHHPELGQNLTLDQQAFGYSWHSRHHVAHITTLRQREGW
jgi:hypothetical protein